MSDQDFSNCTLRVGMELILKYSNLANAVEKALVDAAASHDDHTVVHVHVNDGCDPLHFAEEHHEEIRSLPGLVGLYNDRGGRTQVMKVDVACSYIDSNNHKRLRRIDVFFTPHKH